MKFLQSLLILFLLSPQCWAVLQAHWPLADNAPTSTVDASTGSDGQLVISATPTNTDTRNGPGPPGGTEVTRPTADTGAIEFDSAVDYINIPAAPSQAGEFSYSIFFKPSAFPCPLWGRESQASSYIAITSSTQAVVRIVAGTATTFTLPATVTTDEWHHCLLTRDGSNNVKVYIDGVASVTTLNASGTQASITIGRCGTTYTSPTAALSWAKIFNSDESGNAVALMREGIPSSGRVKTQLLQAKRRRQ